MTGEQQEHSTAKAPATLRRHASQNPSAHWQTYSTCVGSPPLPSQPRRVELNASLATGQIKNKHFSLFNFPKCRITGNHHCLSTFIDICFMFFHIPALLGEGFGLPGCAISWILGSLGVRQLQRPNKQVTSHWSNGLGLVFISGLQPRASLNFLRHIFFSGSWSSSGTVGRCTAARSTSCTICCARGPCCL